MNYSERGSTMLNYPEMAKEYIGLLDRYPMEVIEHMFVNGSQTSFLFVSEMISKGYGGRMLDENAVNILWDLRQIDRFRKLEKIKDNIENKI